MADSVSAIPSSVPPPPPRGDAGSSALPDDIVQSIAITNATAIGTQPATLANLALANQILNNSLQQQMFIANQQAANLIVLATVAKCVSLIASDTGAKPDAAALKDLLDTLKQFQSAQKPPAPAAGAPAS